MYRTTASGVVSKILPTLVETVTGSEGADTLDGTDADEVIYGLGGDDSLTAGLGRDTLWGGDGNDTVVGGLNDRDELVGEAGEDLLILQNFGYAYGGTGNDTIQGNGGGFLWGNDGDDTIINAIATEWVDIRGGEGNDQLSNGGGVDIGLYGDNGNDTLTGSTANYERLDGGAGLDSVNAGGGDDRVFDSDSEADTLIGGDGADLLQAVWASPVNWTLSTTKTQLVAGNVVAGFERVTLYLGDGNDVVKIGGGIGGNYIEGGGGDDKLTSGGDGTSSFSQQLYGGDGNDTLEASNAGNHILEGGNGSDSLKGGKSKDWLYGDNGDYFSQGSDNVSGGGGADIYFEADNGIADTVNGGGGVDTFDANWDAATADIVWQNDATLTQTVFNNSVKGFEVLSVSTGSGNDVITNTLYNAADYISTGDGNDSINAGAGNDTLVAGGGNDTVMGGAGDDVLYSGSGTNVLNGGAGSDKLNGEVGGVNAFVFDTLVGSDTVTNFAAGIDDVVISQAGLPVGNGDLVVDGAIATSGGGFSSANELVVCTQSTGGSTITSAMAAGVIGDATGAYSVGQTAVFVVHSGNRSAVFYFQSADADADVSAAELTMLAELKGTTTTGVPDYVFGA